MITIIIVLAVLLAIALWVLGLIWLEKNLQSKWHFAITCLMFFPALPFIFVHAKYNNYRERKGLKK